MPPAPVKARRRKPSRPTKAKYTIEITAPDGRLTSMPWNEERDPTAAEVDAYARTVFKPVRNQLTETVAGRPPKPPAAQVSHAQKQAAMAAIASRVKEVDEVFGVPETVVDQAPTPELRAELKRRQRRSSESQGVALGESNQRRAIVKSMEESAVPSVDGDRAYVRLKDGRAIPIDEVNRDLISTAELEGAVPFVAGVRDQEALAMERASINPRTGRATPTTNFSGADAVTSVRGGAMLQRGVNKLYEAFGGAVQGALAPNVRSAVRDAVLDQGGTDAEADEALRVFDESFGQMATAIASGTGQTLAAGSQRALQAANSVDAIDAIMGLGPVALQLADQRIPESQRKQIVEGLLNPLIVAPVALAGAAVGVPAIGRAAGAATRSTVGAVGAVADVARDALGAAGEAARPVTVPLRRNARQLTRPVTQPVKAAVSAVGDAVKSGVDTGAKVAARVTDPLAGKVADKIEGGIARRALKRKRFEDTLNVDLRREPGGDAAPEAAAAPKSRVIRKVTLSTAELENADGSIRAFSLDDLAPSHLPDGTPNPRFDASINDSQNRNRSSQSQLDRIRARAANPDYDELIRDTGIVERGIATVTESGQGVAGHGRIATLRLMRDEFPDNWAEYQKRLKAKYPELADIDDAVLVNVLDDASPENVSRIGRTSNSSAADKMSAIEKARNNTSRLPENVEDRFHMDGARSIEDAIRNPKNAAVVEHWVNGLPESERAAARGSDGAGLSAEAAEEFSRAMVVRIMGDDALGVLEKYMVDGEGPKRVMTGIEKAAGSLLELEGAIKRGETGKLGPEVKSTIAKALGYLDEARNSTSFKDPVDWFDQATMAADDYAARKIGKGLAMAKTQGEVTELIERLARGSRSAGGGMFGDDLAFKNIDELVDATLPEVTIARGEGILADRAPGTRRRTRATAEAPKTEPESAKETANETATETTAEGGEKLKRVRAIKSGRVEPAPLPRPSGWRLRSTRRMILDMSKEFKKKINLEKKQKGSLGYYLSTNTNTTIKFSGDLDTAVHELGHMFDDLYGIGKNIPGGKLKQELLALYQMSGKKNDVPHVMLKEGIADYFRALMLNPDAARRIAPEFTARYESLVPDQVRAKITKVSDDVRIWAGLDENTKQIANISRPELRSVTDSVRKWVKGDQGVFELSGWTRLKKYILDDQAPLEQAVREIQSRLGLVELNPMRDPLGAAADMRYIDGKHDAFLEFGVRAPDGSRLTGPAASIIEPVVGKTAAETRANLADLFSYMISKRVAEKAPQMVDDAMKDVAIRRQKVMADSLEAAGFVNEANILRAVTEDGYAAAIGYGKMPVHERVSTLMDMFAQLVEPTNAELAKKLRRAAQIEKSGAVKRAENRRHSLTGAGGGVLSDYDIAMEALDKFQKGDAGKLLALETAARAYRDFADGLLEYGVKNGRWTQEWVDGIRARNESYVAMQRVMDEGPGFVGTRGLTRARKIVNKFEGSTREIKDPFLSLIEQSEKVVFEVERNNAMRALRDLVVEGVEEKRGMYDSPFPVDLTDIMVKVPEGEPGAIRIFVKGKEEFWKIQNKDLQESLDMLGHATLGDLGPVAQLLTLPARVMRQFITTSPSFIVRNLIRDSFQRRLVSQVDPKFRAKGGADWLKSASKEEMALIRELGGSLTEKFYEPTQRGTRRKLRRSTEGGGGFYLEDSSAYKEIQEAMIRKFATTPGERIIASSEDWAGIFGKLSSGSELRGRVAEFRAAYREGIAKGLTTAEAEKYAARKSRGLIDYMRGGTTVKAFNRFIPFLNANIQGMDVELKAMRGDPLKYASRFIKLAIVPTIIARSYNEMVGAGEEYDQLPAWQKDLFWNFKVPDFGWVRIPKPFQAGVLAAGAERAATAAYRFAAGDQEGAAKAYEGYGGSFVSGFMVVNASDMAGGGYAPFVEVMTNHDFFRGGTIVDPWEAKKDIALRENADDRSSRIGQAGSWISGGKLDPREVDHLVKSYTGGWGQIATAASDIGRENKMVEGAQVMNFATGLFTTDASTQAVDVRFVRELASRYGITENPLGDVQKAVFDAKDGRTRRKAAARLRAAGTDLRKKMEEGIRGLDETEAQEKLKTIIKNWQPPRIIE